MKDSHVTLRSDYFYSEKRQFWGKNFVKLNYKNDGRMNEWKILGKWELTAKDIGHKQKRNNAHANYRDNYISNRCWHYY